MSVRMDVAYIGELQCSVMHGPSKDRISTDAPVDNQGRGQHFSPTDLMSAALGACALTTMAIAARRAGWELANARASVVKEMGTEPRRHVSRVTVEIRLPASLDDKKRAFMEETARHCPVAESLGPRTERAFSFKYVD